MKPKIRVLVVDDSSLVRQLLLAIFSQEDDIEVVGTAQDPFVAVDIMRKVKPDVITLDIEMPKMDGVTFLKRLMQQYPIPVVICSSLVGEGSVTHIKALEAGAVDIIKKPQVGTKQFFHDSHVLICDAIRAASKARPKRKVVSSKPATKNSADVMLSKPKQNAMAETTDKVIVIGASTGGTEAIKEVLLNIPLNSPGIVIVQHMPEGFTRSFAERLNSLCEISVKEASNGDPVLRGQALIAPGNKHTLLKRSGARYYVEVKDGPLVSRHRPSVNVLFRSAAKYAGANTLGVILTGMGDDGADGMLELNQAGAWTCAQDEASSVVYGMPKEAVKRGGVNCEVSLNKIAGELSRRS